MDKNRLTVLRTVGFNLLAEGQISRGDCVNELCNEVESLQERLHAETEAAARWLSEAALLRETLKQRDAQLRNQNYCLDHGPYSCEFCPTCGAVP